MGYTNEKGALFRRPSQQRSSSNILGGQGEANSDSSHQQYSDDKPAPPWNALGYATQCVVSGSGLTGGSANPGNNRADHAGYAQRYGFVVSRGCPAYDCHCAGSQHQNES